MLPFHYFLSSECINTLRPTIFWRICNITEVTNEAVNSGKPLRARTSSFYSQKLKPCLAVHGTIHIVSRTPWLKQPRVRVVLKTTDRLQTQILVLAPLIVWSIVLRSKQSDMTLWNRERGKICLICNGGLCWDFDFLPRKDLSFGKAFAMNLPFTLRNYFTPIKK